MTRRAFAAAAVAFFLAAAGNAAALEGPRVDYSADYEVETAEGRFAGRLHASPGKERRELRLDGEAAVIITRQDRKALWMLLPEEKAYVEMKPGEAPDGVDLSGLEVEQTVVGQEKVNGIEATKSKIVARARDGSKLGGFWWTTREGIVVKLDALSVEKGKKDRIKLQLANLQLRRQDPALFEIPRGFSKMPLPGMPGGGGKGLDAQDLVKDAAKLFE